MPRIAHVISTPRGIGGAEQVLLALVEEGRRRGWEQLVLNPFSEAPSGSALATRSSVTVHGFSVPSSVMLPKVRAWLKHRLRDFAPDLTHAHLFHALVVIASIPRTAAEIRVLSHHHGDRMRTQRRRLEEAMDRWSGRRFDRVVACSEWGRNFLIDTYRYSPDRVVTIRNGWSGVPLERVPAPVPTIVCIANLRPPKGHEILLHAFALVRREIPNAELHLLGSGSMEEDLRRLVTEMQVDEGVRFLGNVEDIWPHLARAHVAVTPSTSETLGIAALEAMAAGVPVVASDVGGLPELLEPGVSGLLVPPGDHVSLSAALVEVLSDPQRASRMGEQGRARASTSRMEEMVLAYFQLYEDLLRP